MRDEGCVASQLHYQCADACVHDTLVVSSVAMRGAVSESCVAFRLHYQQVCTPARYTEWLGAA